MRSLLFCHNPSQLLITNYQSAPLSLFRRFIGGTRQQLYITNSTTKLTTKSKNAPRASHAIVFPDKGIILPIAIDIIHKNDAINKAKQSMNAHHPISFLYEYVSAIYNIEIMIAKTENIILTLKFLSDTIEL